MSECLFNLPSLEGVIWHFHNPLHHSQTYILEESGCIRYTFRGSNKLTLFSRLQVDCCLHHTLGCSRVTAAVESSEGHIWLECWFLWRRASHHRPSLLVQCTGIFTLIILTIKKWRYAFNFPDMAYILHLQSIVSLASVADRYGGKLLGNIRNQMQT